MEPCIGQDNHPVVTLGNQGVKRRVVDVGGDTVPATNQALLVQDETELASDNLLMMALAFLADLGRAIP